ncbi:MAG TPA: hypothetical protein VK614_10290 [Allosphingosinicella sp.]|nr:hypothetical protein [Allosphingosinicella sp.]
MIDAVNRFYNSLPEAEALSTNDRIDFFTYFLSEEFGQRTFTVRAVAECFAACDLPLPPSLAQYLSRGTTSIPRKFIKADKGYRLERHMRESLASRLGAETHTVKLPHELLRLETSVPEGPGKNWLKEGLSCLSVEAYRATLIMIWLYVLDHLFQYILKHRLRDFNAALASHPDQRASKKVGAISARDQFTILGEELFLDVCRSAHIISPDLRRMLGGALGLRNSAAHPSGVVITRNRVVTLAEELILNVVLKFAV